MGRPLPLQARRTLRFALAVAIALAVGYGCGLPMPWFPAQLTVILAASGAPPPGARQLGALMAVMLVTLGLGLFLGPMLDSKPATALLLIMVGLYLANRLVLGDGPALIGMLLMVGLTLIPAAATVSGALAAALIDSMAISTIIAVLGLTLVYPLFPEDKTEAPAPEPATDDRHWIAVRATLVVMPPFLLALTNPAGYIPLILKTLLLGRQGSLVDVRKAGAELVGATVLAGCMAVAGWFALKLAPNLWMLFLWGLFLALQTGAHLYGSRPTRFSAEFWQTATVTTLLLLGPAIEDSANGKDVYEAFAVRLTLFVGVALYGWFAITLLEHWRARRQTGQAISQGRI